MLNVLLFGSIKDALSAVAPGTRNDATTVDTTEGVCVRALKDLDFLRLLDEISSFISFSLHVHLNISFSFLMYHGAY